MAGIRAKRETTDLNSEDTLDPLVPRRPERANGRKRFAVLLASAEHILIEEGIDGLTIQRISQIAKVPMASVYHFFPSATAAAVAVAQSYFEAFRTSVASIADDARVRPWRDVVASVMHKTVTFYREHPYAMRLIFGSDHSWKIREADVANNAQMATDLSLSIGWHFLPGDNQRIEDVFAIAIGLTDAVWSLSVARHGTITDDFATEAERATQAYLACFERR